MKRVLGLGFAGWASIVALAWWLADRRIAICYHADDGCILRATASRDAVLTSGLTIGLAAVLAVATMAVLTQSRGREIVQRPLGKPRHVAGAAKAAALQALTNPPARTMLGIVIAAAMFGLGWLFADEAKQGTLGAPSNELATPAEKVTPVEGDPFAGQTSDAIGEADGQATDEADEE